MNSTNKNRPHVPGVSGGNVADDSRLTCPGAGSAYNIRVGSLNCQTTLARNMDKDELKIITYNVRTLRTEERLIELENALKTIKWDVIGLSEVRREGETVIEKDNYTFHYVGNSNHGRFTLQLPPTQMKT